MNNHKYNILYIDDEYNNIVVFKSAFFRDYNIYSATSGQEGLQIIRNNDIHLVITDQKMPGMTGIELLEIVCKEYPDIVRMVLTAFSDIDVIMQAVNKCGIYHYILKPWDIRDLKIKIDNALAKYSLSAENKQLIYNLKKANEELEEKVKQRTSELDEKNRQLTEINAIKDKLFSIISHDLRTPLVSLETYLEVLINLKNGFSFDQIKEYSQKIQSYLKEIRYLLDNLLYWSIEQMEVQKVNIRDIEVDKILKNNINLYKIPAQQKGIELQAKSCPEGVRIMADENMVNLILRNLISNAVKYTYKEGLVNISVEVGEKHAEIKVQDSGIGIPKQSLKTLFDSNNHSVTRGTAQEGGTGIGLKLCKELAEKQSGKLNVSSKEGKGSIFSVSFPIANNN